MSEHYFTDSSSAHRRLEIRVPLAGEERRLVSSNAVFSAHGLDKATAVFLARLDMLAPVSPQATLVDVGCGWGPIALTAAIEHPQAQVWAVDVNERALAATAENAERLGLSNVRVIHADEIPADLHPDVVWSNPPVRIGKESMRNLVAQWVRRLQPSGHAALVVGKNLGADSLQTWLAAQFPEREVSKAASAKGFRIIEVR